VREDLLSKPAGGAGVNGILQNAVQHTGGGGRGYCLRSTSTRTAKKIEARNTASSDRRGTGQANSRQDTSRALFEPGDSSQLRSFAPWTRNSPWPPILLDGSHEANQRNCSCS